MAVTTSGGRGGTAAPGTGIEGKVALVSGAAQGIGEVVAQALAEQGARVAVLDRDEEGLTKTVARLQGARLFAAGYAADVRDSAAVEAAVHRVEEEQGPVDILVNVAGVLRLGAVVDLTDEDWTTVFEVNTQGVFHTSRAVARRMVPRARGAVVTVGSNAAAVPRVRMAAYAASKAAAASFTKCLALELAGHGIRCNVVSPGSTLTPMLRSMWTDDADARATVDGSLPDHRLGIPLRKLAGPRDIADAVVFLVSDRAGHITMHDLRVDGGASLGA